MYAAILDMWRVGERELRERKGVVRLEKMLMIVEARRCVGVKLWQQ